MHKIHWGPVVASAAVGLALSTLPSNSAFGNTAQEVGLRASSGEPAELMHGLVFLTLIVLIVGVSKIKQHRNGHG